MTEKVKSGDSKKTDHDQIFKTVIREFFKEFIELFFPKIAAEIDFTKVEFLDKEHFTGYPEGKSRRMDLIAKVRLKSGEEEFILIHNEFQAAKPEAGENFAQRMFFYSAQLFVRHSIPVIPIAVFTDDHKWNKEIADSYEMSFQDRVYMSFNYHLLKLKNMNWREFLGSNNPLAYALMAKMDYSKKERVKLKAEFLRMILEMGISKTKKSMLVEFIESYIKLNKKEEEEFKELASSDDETYEEVTKMITTYEKRGIEKGILQGMQKGGIKTAIDDVMEVLKLRFGKVPLKVRRSIKACDDLGKLKQLLRQAILAKDISDLTF